MSRVRVTVDESVRSNGEVLYQHLWNPLRLYFASLRL